MVKDCENNSSYIASEYFLIMPLTSHHDYHQEGQSAWFESALQPWLFPGFYTLNLGPSLCLVPCALCLVPCPLSLVPCALSLLFLLALIGYFHRSLSS